MPNSLYMLPCALLDQNLSVGLFLFFSKVCYNVIKNSRQVVNMVKVRKIPVVVDAEQISEVQYI
ncbi:hypothetical protein ODU37_06410, partial [Streptococcus sp. 2021WUSS109]